MYELARVDKNDTGLRYDLRIDSLGKNRRGVPPHIFVCVGRRVDSCSFVVGFGRIARQCRSRGCDVVRKYVRAYMSVFCAHYNKLLTDRQALNLLLRIEEAGSESVNLTFCKIGLIKGNL